MVTIRRNIVSCLVRESSGFLGSTNTLLRFALRRKRGHAERVTLPLASGRWRELSASRRYQRSSRSTFAERANYSKNSCCVAA